MEKEPNATDKTPRSSTKRIIPIMYCRGGVVVVCSRQQLVLLYIIISISFLNCVMRIRIL